MPRQREATGKGKEGMSGEGIKVGKGGFSNIVGRAGGDTLDISAFKSLWGMTC
jgi:hypothetical protein